ncbi:helix-turn-helix domain-containing protein [Hyphococcus sp.]|uniref:helix-turn-helix domain-containing protein n=1 Tax=Hyphococcus sp. TaxID=2038636 RepID=UPI003CCBC1C3
MESSFAIAARSIGDRIRQARKAKGLSQSDLALRVGVSQPAIANWESGIHDPRRLTLAKLADALGAPLDWLAAGDRSMTESDKHAAAAYIRRPVRHVPVISLRTATLIAKDPSIDPHAFAEDYLPVTLGASKLFAVFINDAAVNQAFLPDTVVIVDYDDRAPEDGDFCLAQVGDAPMLRRYRASPARLEPASNERDFPSTIMSGAVKIIGCVRVSIRIH